MSDKATTAKGRLLGDIKADMLAGGAAGTLARFALADICEERGWCPAATLAVIRSTPGQLVGSGGKVRYVTRAGGRKTEYRIRTDR
jgi:hypothetical protein